MHDDMPSTTTKKSSPLDQEEGRSLVEAWRASGMTGAEYCRANNLRPARLHYWRERLGYPIRVLRKGRGEPIAHAPAAPAANGFAQLIIHDHASTTAVDIVVDGGVVRVRPGFDAGLLRDVIAALRPTL